MDFGGRVTMFLLSWSGFQEVGHVSLERHHPAGVTSSSFDPQRAVLYVTGPPKVTPSNS